MYKNRFEGKKVKVSTDSPHVAMWPCDHDVGQNDTIGVLAVLFS